MHAKKSIKSNPVLFAHPHSHSFLPDFFRISHTRYSLQSFRKGGRIPNIEPTKHVIAFIRMQMEISMLHTCEICLCKRIAGFAVINFDSEDLQFSSLFRHCRHIPICFANVLVYMVAWNVILLDFVCVYASDHRSWIYI